MTCRYGKIERIPPADADERRQKNRERIQPYLPPSLAYLSAKRGPTHTTMKKMLYII